MSWGEPMKNQKEDIISNVNKLNLNYSVDDKSKRIIVGDYWICYTNFYFGKNNNNKSIGRGHQEFLKLLNDYN